MMPEKDPNNYSLLTYLWVLLISTWGGIAGIIAAVMVPTTALQGFAFKNYTDGRKE